MIIAQIVFMIFIITVLYVWMDEGFEKAMVVLGGFVIISIVFMLIVRPILGLSVEADWEYEFKDEPSEEQVLYSPDGKIYVEDAGYSYNYYVQAEDGTYTRNYTSSSQTEIRFDPDATVGKLLTYKEIVNCKDDPQGDWWYMDIDDCPTLGNDAGVRYTLIIPADSLVVLAPVQAEEGD